MFHGFFSFILLASYNTNAPEHILVYDIMEHELLSTPYSSSFEKIVELNISNLSAGLYFVKLSVSNTDSAPLTFSVY